jgi:hypothetical protein
MSSWFGSGGIWGGFRQSGAAIPPGGKQLMLPRLMNLLINPFARITYDGLANFQKTVYRWGDWTVLGFTADIPQWPTIEFNTLGALKTGRSRILLPDDFVLLSYWASASSNVKGGFRVMVYDVNRRIPLTIRPADFNAIAGQGSAPLFLQAPYPFGKSINNSPPQAKITIVNLETVANLIQFGFYGVIAPNYQQVAAGWPKA